MKILEIIDFMNPFSDGLSTLFVSAIVIASIGTWLWLEMNSKPANWQRNWDGDWHDDDSGLDGYGSVHELSDIVATKAERVAAIMPSLLLVVGLLGTFIGLGMALNNASSVLANIDTVGMDGAMGQLTGMMEGLGAKFKTSTWGILCFILLNVTFNARAYDDKRLAWVIGTLQKESQQKRQHQEKFENDKYNFLKAIAQSSQQNLTQLEKVASYSESTQQSMNEFVDKTVDSMASIGDSAKSMSAAALAVGNSARELNIVVENLQGELTQVMQMIRTDLGDTITNMGGSFEENMADMASSMKEATTGISNSVSLLSTSIDNILTNTREAITKSMDLQLKASTNFDATVDSLNTQINEVTELVNKLSGDLDQSLRTVAKTSRQIGGLASGFESVAQKDEKLTESNAKLADKVSDFIDNDSKQQQKISLLSDKLERLSASIENLIEIQDKQNRG